MKTRLKNTKLERRVLTEWETEIRWTTKEKLWVRWELINDRDHDAKRCRMVRVVKYQNNPNTVAFSCKSSSMRHGATGRLPCCYSHLETWLEGIGPVEAARNHGLIPWRAYKSQRGPVFLYSLERNTSQTRTKSTSTGIYIGKWAEALGCEISEACQVIADSFLELGMSIETVETIRALGLGRDPENAGIL